MKFHNQKSFMGHEISNVKNKPLLHKKGKQWIVVAVSALILAGFGCMVSTTTHAATQSTTTKVAPKPAKSTTPAPSTNNTKPASVTTPKATQPNTKNIGQQATNLHKNLVNNSINAPKLLGNALAANPTKTSSGHFGSNNNGIWTAYNDNSIQFHGHGTSWNDGGFNLAPYSNIYISDVQFHGPGHMFSGLTNLKTITFAKNVTNDAQYMDNDFNGDSNLQTINGLNNFMDNDTHLIDYDFMFNDCKSLRNLDLTGLNSKNIPTTGQGTYTNDTYTGDGNYKAFYNTPALSQVQLGSNSILYSDSGISPFFVRKGQSDVIGNVVQLDNDKSNTGTWTLFQNENAHGTWGNSSWILDNHGNMLVSGGNLGTNNNQTSAKISDIKSESYDINSHTTTVNNASQTIVPKVNTIIFEGVTAPNNLSSLLGQLPYVHDINLRGMRFNNFSGYLPTMSFPSDATIELNGSYYNLLRNQMNNNSASAHTANNTANANSNWIHSSGTPASTSANDADNWVNNNSTKAQNADNWVATNSASVQSAVNSANDAYTSLTSKDGSVQSAISRLNNSFATAYNSATSAESYLEKNSGSFSTLSTDITTDKQNIDNDIANKANASDISGDINILNNDIAKNNSLVNQANQLAGNNQSWINTNKGSLSNASNEAKAASTSAKTNATNISNNSANASNSAYNAQANAETNAEDYTSAYINSLSTSASSYANQLSQEASNSISSSVSSLNSHIASSYSSAVALAQNMASGAKISAESYASSSASSAYSNASSYANTLSKNASTSINAVVNSVNASIANASASASSSVASLSNSASAGINKNSNNINTNSNMASKGISSANASASASASNAQSVANKNSASASASVSAASSEAQSLANKNSLSASVSASVANSNADSYALSLADNAVNTANQNAGGINGNMNSNYNIVKSLSNTVNANTTSLANDANDLYMTKENKSDYKQPQIQQIVTPQIRKVAYLYVLKPVWLHTGARFTKHNRAKILSSKHGYTLPITKAFRVHGALRFEIKMNGKHYFVTGQRNFTRNAYIQPNEVNHHSSVKVLKDIREYKKAGFGDKNFIRDFKKGSVLPIKRVKTISSRRMTRLQLTNGHWITANKNLVKLI